MRFVRRLAAVAPWLLISLCAQDTGWQQLHNHVAELVAQQRTSELLPAALQTLRVAESTFGVMHPATAVSTYDVALAYDSLHQYAEAETFYRRALTLEEKTLGPDSPEIPKCLNNLAALYNNTKREAEAAPLFQRAIDILSQSAAPDAHQHMIAPLVNLAGIYRDQKKYPEAESLYRQALGFAEKDNSPGHIPSDIILYPLATLYAAEGKQHDAEIALKRTLAIRERSYGPDAPQLEEPLHGLGATESNLGHFEQAESYLQRALKIAERNSGSDLETAAVLSGLASVYKIQEKYTAGEPLLRRALSIREKVLGPSNPQTIDTLLTLAVLLRGEGRSSEVRPLCQRALTFQEKALGADSPALADALLCVATSYYDQDDFASAEPVLKRAVQILQSPNVDRPAQLANALNSLAELYRNAGRFAEAEPLYRNALAITSRDSGQENADYARILNNLGLLYADQGRYADAEPLHQQSLAICEKVVGPDKLQTTYALNSLAQIYIKTGQYGQAEPLLRRSLKIREAIYGLDHPLVGTIVNNLAIVYSGEGRCANAEPLQRRALAIDEKRLGHEHPIVAIDLSNLGSSWVCLGRDAEAGKSFSRALDIVDKTLPPNHLGVISALKELASFYQGAGDYRKAAPLFDRLLASVEYQFRNQLSFMSEKDRLSFVATVDDVFPRYFSFCLQYQDRDPSLAGRMYDLALWRKGLVARSVVSLKAQIAASGDKEASANLQQLAQRTARLSALELDEANHPGNSREAIAQLRHEINDLETGLARRSGVFANRQRLDQIKWQDISKALKPGERAVELLRFRIHDGKKWQRVEYVALLTSSGMAPPKIIPLGDASMLEGVPWNDYRERVKQGPPPDDLVGSVFFRNVWKPMEPSLGDSKRIYLSPDGLFSEVAWGVLPTGDGHLLCERYEIDLLSSTRDLLDNSSLDNSSVDNSSPNSARSAVLIGSPDFDLSQAAYRAALKNSASHVLDNDQIAALTPAPLRNAGGGGQPLAPLPGTRQELQMLQAVLREHGWTTTVRTGPEALEENVKSIRSPRLLHLATHGFFTADADQSGDKSSDSPTTTAPDPMLSSGLYLAGANQSLAGKLAEPDLDDGVLTAFEASTLTLLNTELVVLSACETGLGVTRNGEGVFGLRRALQEAGAKAVLMSLWKVPDQETEELMKLFYEKWLSGENKQKALREAQLEMRQRVKARRDGDDIPFYWGAFVLVGN